MPMPAAAAAAHRAARRGKASPATKAKVTAATALHPLNELKAPAASPQLQAGHGAQFKVQGGQDCRRENPSPRDRRTSTAAYWAKACGSMRDGKKL